MEASRTRQRVAQCRCEANRVDAIGLYRDILGANQNTRISNALPPAHSVPPEEQGLLVSLRTCKSLKTQGASLDSKLAHTPRDITKAYQARPLSRAECFVSPKQFHPPGMLTGGEYKLKVSGAKSSNQANDAISTFLANMSHEFRIPKIISDYGGFICARNNGCGGAVFEFA